MSTLLLPIAQPKIRTSTGALAAYGAASLAVALGYIGMHLLRPTPAFPLDDPYITLHSAQVLHSGFDPNYPGVSPLYGSTSAPFLALVYLLLFVLPPLSALDAACWLGVLLYLLGLVRMARAFRMTQTEGLLLVIVGMTTSFVPFHLLNGLETSWSLACVTWTLTLASGEKRNWSAAAFVAGFAAGVRPDLLPFTGLLIAALTFQCYRTNRSLRYAALHGALFAALASVAILPWVLWFYHATGVPFPQTGVAKRYFLAQDGLPWTTKAMVEGSIALLFMASCGPLILLLPKIRRYPLGTAVLLTGALFLAAVYVQFPSALYWNSFRYPMTLVPMLVWALGITTSAANFRYSARRFLRICAVCSLLLLPISIWSYLRSCRYYDRGLRDVATWCERNLPHDAKLLVHDAGYLAYRTHFRIVDVVGLKTPDAIEINRRYTWPSVGVRRAEAVAHLARDTHAEYLVVVQNWPAVAAIPEQMHELGWGVSPLRTEGAYWVFRVTEPQEQQLSGAK